MNSLRTMIEVSGACSKREADELIDNIRGCPAKRRILDELFTEDVGDFMRTVRSMVWHIKHSKHRKAAWDGIFILHRRSRIRMMGLDEKIKAR